MYQTIGEWAVALVIFLVMEKILGEWPTLIIVLALWIWAESTKHKNGRG